MVFSCYPALPQGRPTPALTRASVRRYRRFDRQIRIWGQTGQESLEASSVCLLTASATGAEALKNLVLGGVPHFVIIDDARVCGRDLGQNFFVDATQLGQPRAAAVAARLAGLSDYVRGAHVEASPVDLVRDRPNFVRDFTLILATQVSDATAARLDAACRQAGVALVVARTSGLSGMVRPSFTEAVCLETHPEGTTPDVRVHRPWPALLAAATSELDLDALDDVQHAHVPWALLLTRATANWAAAHEGKTPAASDREAFVAQVRALERRSVNANADLVREINVAEAAQQARLVWSPASISSNLRALLNDPLALDPAPAWAGDADRAASAGAGDGGLWSLVSGAPVGGAGPDKPPRGKSHLTRGQFWVCVAALRLFLADTAASDGELPLSGSLPDMTSSTERFVELQRLFRAKAEADAASVAAHADDVLVQLGVEPGEVSLPRSLVAHFCRHCREARVVRPPRLLAPPAPGTPLRASPSPARSGERPWSTSPEAIPAGSASTSARGRATVLTGNPCIDGKPLPDLALVDSDTESAGAADRKSVV